MSDSQVWVHVRGKYECIFDGEVCMDKDEFERLRKKMKAGGGDLPAYEVADLIGSLPSVHQRCIPVDGSEELQTFEKAKVKK